MLEPTKTVYGKADVVKCLGIHEGSDSEFLVIPLTEELIARFLIKIPENEEAYGITASQRRNGRCLRKFNVYDFDCDYVMNGKFVRISAWGRNFFNSVEHVTFSGDGVGARHLYSRFLAFIENQDFEKLKEVVGKSMSLKLKRDMVNNLGILRSREIEEFYKL